MKDVEQIKHASMIDELQKIAFNIDLKMGDVILTGKWKNVREIVKKFGTNDVGQPTVNGKSLLNLRIEKSLPNSKKSSETLAAELDKVKEAAFHDELQKIALSKNTMRSAVEKLDRKATELLRKRPVTFENADEAGRRMGQLADVLDGIGKRRFR